MRTLTLVLLGVGLATSAWAVPLDMVELVDSGVPHSLLAVTGLVGLAVGGRVRRRTERA